MKLVYETISRVNTRRTQYNKRDMVRALERVGCTVTCQGLVLRAERVLKDGEDPKVVRGQMSDAIRRVHRNAPKKFKGLID